MLHVPDPTPDPTTVFTRDPTCNLQTWMVTVLWPDSFLFLDWIHIVVVVDYVMLIVDYDDGGDDDYHDDDDGSWW